MTVNDEEAPPARSALVNPRLERLLAIGREMNDIRFKIKLANDFISRGGLTGDVEEVSLARGALREDLEREASEARELIPIVDELVSSFEREVGRIDERRNLHEALAKIEGLSGFGIGAATLEGEASRDRARAAELQNLVAALDELIQDFTQRRELIVCPKCSSHDVGYRITPSEFGFTLY
jgi:hypothetical protein